MRLPLMLAAAFGGPEIWCRLLALMVGDAQPHHAAHDADASRYVSALLRPARDALPPLSLLISPLGGNLSYTPLEIETPGFDSERQLCVG